MGLFDKLGGIRQQTDITLGPAESFAAIAYLAIAADGYAADTEIQGLMTTLYRMQLYRSYPGDVMRKMFDRIQNIIQRHGSEALLNAAVASLPDDLRETLFAVTTDLILADGEVTQEEENLLNGLCSALRITEQTALKIIDVMLIKNRG
jgi:tellurite resistance protein